MADDLLTPAKGKTYDASSIQVLEDMEHVRLRPGMYIGGKDDRALHHMVAEIIDNSMDEAVAGHANWIEVELHEDHSVTIRDNGRGIDGRDPGGLGLRNMEERAAQLDGRLRIFSARGADGTGTVIEATVPLSHMLPPDPELPEHDKARA